MSTQDGTTAALSRIPQPDLLIICALSRATAYKTGNISAAMRFESICEAAGLRVYRWAYPKIYGDAIVTRGSMAHFSSERCY